MGQRKQIYVWLGGSLLVALGLNYATPWSLMLISTFTLAYATKGSRRSPRATGGKNQKN